MSGDLKECHWFSVEVGLELAPWLMSEGGNPKRGHSSIGTACYCGGREALGWPRRRQP